MNKIKKLFEQVDLTKGTIWKVIIWFSIPILISYLFQQIYSIADASICGKYLNVNQVAGVNNTSNIVFIVLQFAFGCTAGFSVVTSNKVGQKDEEGVKKSFAIQIKLSLYISVLLTIIACLMAKPMLSMIGLTESSNLVQNEIFSSAYTYVMIIFIGTTAQMFYNLICSFLRSIGDSFVPLIFLILSTILNIILDLIFIAIFKWGVVGAAVATVIAQVISAIGCFIYTYLRYPNYRLKKEHFKTDFRFTLNHLKLGIPLALQFSILAIGLIVMQAVIIKFDTTLDNEVIRSYAQNGFGAASKLNSFLMCPFNALGTAMLSYCGQNYGAAKTERIKEGVAQALLISIIEYIVFGGIGLLLTINGFYMQIFYSAEKINEMTIYYGNTYLYCDLSLYFILGTLFVFRNSLQGIGKSLYPLLAGIAELIARTAICLILPPILNNGPISVDANNKAIFGLTFADPLAWSFAVIILTIGIVKYICKNDKKVKNIN